jgi:hypothetical protein
MKRNENIYISLEIQKDLDAKGLLLSIQFDRNAPNFHQENEVISWCPTSDELDFIKEAFNLLGGNTMPLPVKEVVEQEVEVPSEMDQSNYSHRSSEIRIAPLPNNMRLEEAEEPETTYSREKDLDEKVFIQADERKIDEILKRKKQMSRNQNTAQNEDKVLIDKMMKQKKKR